MTEKIHFRNGRSAYHVSREKLLTAPPNSFFRKLYECKVEWDEVADYCSYYRKNSEMHVFINVSPRMFKHIIGFAGIISTDVNDAIDLMLSTDAELLKVMKIFGIDNADITKKYEKKLEDYNKLIDAMKKIIIYFVKKYHDEEHFLIEEISKLTFNNLFYLALSHVDEQVIDILAIIARSVTDNSEISVKMYCDYVEKIEMPPEYESIKKSAIKMFRSDIYTDGFIDPEKIKKNFISIAASMLLKIN